MSYFPTLPSELENYIIRTAAARQVADAVAYFQQKYDQDDFFTLTYSSRREHSLEMLKLFSKCLFAEKEIEHRETDFLRGYRVHIKHWMDLHASTKQLKNICKQLHMFEEVD